MNLSVLDHQFICLRWKYEADEQGSSSRSRYLQDWIREARALRAQGFLAPQQSEQTVQSLEQTIHQLRARIEHLQKKQRGRTDVDDEAFLLRE